MCFKNDGRYYDCPFCTFLVLSYQIVDYTVTLTLRFRQSPSCSARFPNCHVVHIFPISNPIFNFLRFAIIITPSLRCPRRGANFRRRYSDTRSERWISLTGRKIGTPRAAPPMSESFPSPRLSRPVIAEESLVCTTQHFRPR